MLLFCGLDLHANNTYAIVIDECDQPLLDRRLSDNLDIIADALEPFRQEIACVAVELAFTWY